MSDRGFDPGTPRTLPRFDFPRTQRHFTVGRGRQRAVTRMALGAHKVRRPLTGGQKLLRRFADNFHDARHLIVLIFAGENWKTRYEFDEDAAEAPHVDGHAVLGADNNFGRAIKPRLDVRVDALVLVTARAEVNDLHPAAAGMFEENVLGFHVAVNNFIAVEQVQTEKHRMRKFAHKRHAEAFEFVFLQQFVQVDTDHLENNADVVSKRKRLPDVHDVHRVVLVLLFQQL
jgi:hypothetical protein